MCGVRSGLIRTSAQWSNLIEKGVGKLFYLYLVCGNRGTFEFVFNFILFGPKKTFKIQNSYFDHFQTNVNQTTYCVLVQGLLTGFCIL